MMVSSVFCLCRCGEMLSSLYRDSGSDTESSGAKSDTDSSKSLFEKSQAASRLSIKRVIATYTNVSLVLGNSS